MGRISTQETRAGHGTEGRFVPSWLACFWLLAGFLFWSGNSKAPATPTVLEPAETPAGQAKATFASGCFWCTDAVFRKLKGVRLGGGRVFGRLTGESDL